MIVQQSNNLFLRFFLLLLLVCLPVILLIFGIYGSFLFTFLIPLFWQLVVCNKPVKSLGLSKNRIISSILIGIISGIGIALAGGFLLRLINISNDKFVDLGSLQFSFAFLDISFPLEKELGYQLLTKSLYPAGFFIYLLFSIFIIGLGEEIFWRGFIQKKIAKYLPVNLSIWATAVLFSSIHFYIFEILSVKKSFIFLIIIAIAGVVWGYLFNYFKNIWVSAISHGLAAFIIWKYYFFVVL